MCFGERGIGGFELVAAGMWGGQFAPFGVDDRRPQQRCLAGLELMLRLWEVPNN